MGEGSSFDSRPKTKREISVLTSAVEGASSNDGFFVSLWSFCVVHILFITHILALFVNGVGDKNPYSISFFLFDTS